MRISVKGKKYDVHVNRIVIILTMGYFLGVRSPELEKNVITPIPSPSITIPSPKPKPILSKKKKTISSLEESLLHQRTQHPDHTKQLQEMGYLTEEPIKVAMLPKELIIKEESIRKKIFSESVVDGNITYLNSQIKFRGKYKIYFVKIPFNLVGHFYKENGYVHFKVDSLSKSGKPYSEKIPEVQKKLMNLFKDEDYKIIKIMDQGKMLYDQKI